MTKPAMTMESNGQANLGTGSTRAIVPPSKEDTIKGEEAPKSRKDIMGRDILAGQASATTADMARTHSVHGNMAITNMGWVPVARRGQPVQLEGRVEQHLAPKTQKPNEPVLGPFQRMTPSS
jgi:hypothetical protein